MDEGKLWSLIRNVLSQGGAIQLDRASMSGYEEYSARLDAAAAERVPDFTKLADARIAEMERDNERIDAQWRDELRIYRETENSRIAELEQAVTVRDTEIARLETDLELARRDAERYRWLARFASYSHIGQENGEWFKRWTFAGPLAYALEGETLGEAIDKARAGNGGGV